MKTKILIAGGSGLIGQRLIQKLSNEQYDIHVLSRSARASTADVTYHQWDTKLQNINQAALDNVDVIVNLAGAGIADKRWTKQRKEIILSSRIDACDTLNKYLQNLKDKPIYIGASAVGIYGHREDDIMHEESIEGEGFLAKVTKLWEEANNRLAPHCKRFSLLRIGIVLSLDGGALKEIVKPAKTGVFGYFGNGSAYYSWIHIDDICNMVEFLINNQHDGVFNATAPEPVTIKTLVQAVKNTMQKPGLVVPVPKFGLKLVMGEMADMLFNSTRVVPSKFQKVGFKFEYEDLKKALKNLLN